MNWIVLIIAGLFEVGWAIGLKYTEGFTRLWPSVFTVSSMIVSLALLGLAMRSLPAGTAYAIWVGVGIVGTVLAGIFFLGEPGGMLKIASIVLIIVGIVGLKFSSAS
jgi:quaternary ammonium compound-resistance protein SugE